MGNNKHRLKVIAHIGIDYIYIWVKMRTRMSMYVGTIVAYLYSVVAGDSSPRIILTNNNNVNLYLCKLCPPTPLKKKWECEEPQQQCVNEDIHKKDILWCSVRDMPVRLGLLWFTFHIIPCITWGYCLFFSCHLVKTASYSSLCLPFGPLQVLFSMLHFQIIFLHHLKEPVIKSYFEFNFIFKRK